MFISELSSRNSFDFVHFTGLMEKFDELQQKELDGKEADIDTKFDRDGGWAPLHAAVFLGKRISLNIYRCMCTWCSM